MGCSASKVAADAAENSAYGTKLPGSSPSLRRRKGWFLRKESSLSSAELLGAEDDASLPIAIEKKKEEAEEEEREVDAEEDVAVLSPERGGAADVEPVGFLMPPSSPSFRLYIVDDGDGASGNRTEPSDSSKEFETKSLKRKRRRFGLLNVQNCCSINSNSVVN